jgi:hypothetical protein
MSMKGYMNSRPSKEVEPMTEKFAREERDYRADKLVEKWSRVPEVGKGIKQMPVSTARNLAILLENQVKTMSKMNEAQLSQSFYGYTPENMLRIVRLSYPNSVRGDIFTEFAMESSHDSIKYIKPVYTNAQRNDFDWDNSAPNGAPMHGADWPMDNRFDDQNHVGDVFYESGEHRYATELVNVGKDKIAVEDGALVVTFDGGALTGAYIPGYSTIYVVVGKDRFAIAQQDGHGAWFGGKNVFIGSDKYIRCSEISQSGKSAGLKIEIKTTEAGDYAAATVAKVESEAGDDFTVDGVAVKFAAVGRFDSEQDLTGKYLGEVELVMDDYHFRPRPISLGVTWTQMTELVLDTSFGLSAEELLLDYASQEIKKELDFQSIRYASDVQKVFAADNFVQFDAAYASGNPGTKDSYWHQAQLVGQAIGRVEDNMLDEFGRGGVTAIVGGTKATRYLELNEGWSTKGAQPKIGAHKVGELNGVPVFKVPQYVLPKDQLITTWKNDQAEGDVCIAIGTLIPFLSTGALQRKNLYKEGAIARYEDTKALQPKYLGRIQIANIQVK